MPDKRPNFLVVVADDLGFSDLGCYGSEINTPNIDKIASQGVRFTDFHAAGASDGLHFDTNCPHTGLAACSPTRAMIMTGTDHHIAGLGNLIEWTNISGQNDPSGTGSTAPQRGMPGYEGYLNERVATLPEILRDAGYETLMAGKWHLGLTKERSAQKRGFERSLSHLPACSNHYLYEPQLVDQDQTPTFLEASFIGLHMEDGEYVKKLPDGWYSSHGYGDKMVQYLQDRVDRKEDRPFFAYLPFTAPHWPLQAPQEYIKKYQGVYADGPDALRLKRLAKLQELGLVPKDITPHPVVADEVKAWAEMSDDERAKSARAMEVFAAMVECIDVNVGKVVDFLEKSGELENTFVCFMSDNGAEGAAYEAYPIVQGSVMQHLAKYYNNSLDNLGNYNSFIWYGPRWAQAATAPSRLFKAYTTEGGVRVPFTCKFPAGVKVDQQASGITHQFATVMDLAPTILDMAGVKHPAPTYQGREVVHMRGKTMLPWVVGDQDSIHEKDFIQGWETCGRAACRQGDWKIVFIPKPKGPERWQLYNLTSDPGETDDLSSAYPDKLAHLIKLWDQYVLETGVIPLSPALGEYIAATELQMEENAWMEFDYWKPGAREAPEDPRFKRAPPRFKREVKAF